MVEIAASLIEGLSQRDVVLGPTEVGGLIGGGVHDGWARAAGRADHLSGAIQHIDLVGR